MPFQARHRRLLHWDFEKVCHNEAKHKENLTSVKTEGCAARIRSVPNGEKERVTVVLKLILI